MNKIDYYITSVVKEPYKRIDNNFCCWETIVIASCYGSKFEHIFRACSISEIKKYVKGYHWSE